MSSKFITSMLLPGLLIHGSFSFAVEPSDAARKLLSELTVRESAEPIRNHPEWTKPERIIFLSSGIGSGLNEERLARLQSAADGAELLVLNTLNEAKDKLADTDVLMGSCAAVLPEMQNLKWVQHFTAGVEGCVGHQGFLQSGAMLSNMKGVYGSGIAEHVIAMMFSFSRGLHEFERQRQAKKWDRSLAGRYPMLELRDKTLFIVGLGGIGTEIAWRAHGLGMRVIASRNSSRAKPDFVDYVGLSDELYELAAEADIVVNTTPLTSSTTGLFDRRFFSKLKSSAYFINVGRGKSVVTADLVSALKSGKLAGAGLDVVEPEPLAADHELWTLPNVIITPHISGRSDLVMQRFWIFIRENLRRYVQGEKLLNVVNLKKGY